MLKQTDIRLTEPPIQQRRGAIRGVTILFQVRFYSNLLKIELVNPPEGMKIVGPSNFGHNFSKYGTDIRWNVPMDAEEGKFYNITVKATNFEGKTAEITFPIKVPKTKAIQTTLVNNELTVTDKSSNLYGMKMKGHSGEDISELRLRAVEYGDVWKKRVKNKKPEDVVENVVFILDNMPAALKIKMPSWMDTYKKAKKLLVSFSTYRADSLHSEAWTGAVEGLIRYENYDGYLYKRGSNKIRNIFMLMPTKAQYLGNDYE